MGKKIFIGFVLTCTAIIAVIITLMAKEHIFRIEECGVDYGPNEMIATSQFFNIPGEYGEMASVKYEGDGEVIVFTSSDGFVKMNSGDSITDVNNVCGFVYVNQNNGWNNQGTFEVSKGEKIYKYRVFLRNGIAIYI